MRPFLGTVQVKDLEDDEEEASESRALRRSSSVAIQCTYRRTRAVKQVGLIRVFQRSAVVSQASIRRFVAAKRVARFRFVWGTATTIQRGWRLRAFFLHAKARAIQYYWWVSGGFKGDFDRTPVGLQIGASATIQ